MVYTFGCGYFPGEGKGAKYYDCDILEPKNFEAREIEFDYVGNTFDPKELVRGEPYLSGYRVNPETLPKKILYADKRPPLDFDTFAGLMFLSAAAKALIEQFEPGVHQFEPVEYVRPNGDQIDIRYVFFICRRLDTVDRASTNMILSPFRWTTPRSLLDINPELVPPGTNLDEPVVKLFNLSQIGDAHLWRDRHISVTPFVSTALAEAIKSSGLLGFGGGPQGTVP